MSLPDRNRTFYFDYTDEFGNRTEGNFTIKCRLTMRERHAMELEKSRALGGNQNPTNALMGIAVMAATLSTHIVKSPNWWEQSNNGMDLEDENVVVALYDQLTSEQLAWRDELVKNTLDSTKEVEETQDTPLGNGSVETK